MGLPLVNHKADAHRWDKAQQNLLLLILASEGEKTAMVNRAEAQKQQAILHAEGEAQARIRKAEAEAKAIELITEAVGKSTNPANYLLAQKYIQMMQELANGDKTKTVYLPYEATNLLGSIGGIDSIGKLWDNTKNLIGDGFDYVGNLIGLSNKQSESNSESDSDGPNTAAD